MGTVATPAGRLPFGTAKVKGRRPPTRRRAAATMDDDAEFLRAQARKCRWLADRVNAPDVVQSLLQMARDYEERADRPRPIQPPIPESD